MTTEDRRTDRQPTTDLAFWKIWNDHISRHSATSHSIMAGF